MPVTRIGRAARETVTGLPRAFWWLWTSTLINRLGGFVATFMALYLTQERGHSASYAGLVAALYGLGGVVSSLGGGVLTDRLGRRPTLMLAQSATAVTVTALGFTTHPAAIPAVAFAVGMASNASRPAVQAMMADIVPPEHRVRAFSLNYWAINLGFAISSTGAGFIAEHSYRAGFLIEGVLTLTCAILVFVKLPESRPERPAGAEGDAADPVSLGTVVRDGRFMGVVGLSFLISLIFMQAYVSLPVAMGDQGFSSSDFGLAIAVNGVLIVVLQIPVTRFIEHRDPRTLLVVSSLLAGYGFGLSAFAGSVAVYALVICVWTLGEIVNAPTQTSIVVRLSPVHGRGRYQGMYTTSWAVAALAAPLLGGWVIDAFGAGWLWAGCAAVGTVTAAGYALLMRGLPTEDPVSVAVAGPGGKPVAEPGADSVAEPAVEPVADPAVEPVVEPAAESAGNAVADSPDEPRGKRLRHTGSVGPS